MYQTPFQVVALKSSAITSVSDLAGKRVSVGPAGGTRGTYWPQFMSAVGVQAEISNAGAADAAGQLTDGLIGAFAFAAGAPVSAFAELGASQDVVMFGFTADEQAKVLAAFPAMASFTIPSGTYAGHDYDQNTLALWKLPLRTKTCPIAWPMKSPSWPWTTTIACCKSTQPHQKQKWKTGTRTRS